VCITYHKITEVDPKHSELQAVAFSGMTLYSQVGGDLFWRNLLPPYSEQKKLTLGCGWAIQEGLKGEIRLENKKTDHRLQERRYSPVWAMTSVRMEGPVQRAAECLSLVLLLFLQRVNDRLRKKASVLLVVLVTTYKTTVLQPRIPQPKLSLLREPQI
jgi:hypothetical protein